MVKKTAQVKQIISKYDKVLKDSNIWPSRFILYGSYANGKPTSWSDIDVVVVAKTFGRRDIFDRMEFLSKKAAEVDDSLEVLGYTEDELSRAQDTIFGEIVSTGKVFSLRD